MAKSLELRYEAEVAVDTLKPHPQNDNLGDTNAIAESIEANQFYGAILVQESTRTIITGEHRWKAAIQQGAKTIPVVWANIDDEAALSILTADNRVADLGATNQKKLIKLLKKLATSKGKLGGTGYRQSEYTALLAATSKKRKEAAAKAAVVKPKEPKAAESKVKVKIGPIQFRIDRAEYEAWVKRLVEEVKSDDQAVLAEAMIKKLGLRPA
jgi:ParB-like chromosome segregation protein Spo0J